MSLTPQDIANADADVQFLSATLTQMGTATNRLGNTVKTLPQILSEQLTQEQQAEQFADAAQDSQTAAANSAAAAHNSELSAANSAALCAAAIADPSMLDTYATYAQALAAAGGIAANKFVQVLQDETQQGFRTLYQKQGGNLVLAYDFSNGLFKNVAITGGNGVRIRFNHPNLPAGEKFNLVLQSFPNQSSAGTNNVMTLGSNNGINGGVEDNSKPAIFDQWEQNFNQGAVVANGPDLQERHWVARGADGIERRPITTAVPRAGGVPGQSTTMRFEKLIGIDWIDGNKQLFDWSNDTLTLEAAQKLFLRFPGAAIRQWNATANDFLAYGYYETSGCYRIEQPVVLNGPTADGISIKVNSRGNRAGIDATYKDVQANDTIWRCDSNTNIVGDVFPLYIRFKADAVKAELTNTKAGGKTEYTLQGGNGGSAGFAFVTDGTPIGNLTATTAAVEITSDVAAGTSLLKLMRANGLAIFAGAARVATKLQAALLAAGTAGTNALQGVSDYMGSLTALARSDGNTWKVGFNAFAPPRTRLLLSAVQSIANNTNVDILWDAGTPVVDEVPNMYVSGTSRVNINVPTGASFVRVSGQAFWGLNQVGVRELKIYKNGNVLVAAESYTASNNQQKMFSTQWLPVTGGDRLKLTVTQNSGGALDFSASSGLQSSIEFEWR